MTKIAYSLTYPVQADTPLGAIMKAGGMLRRGVTTTGVTKYAEVAPGLYEVTMSVEEDPGAGDPPEPAWDLPESADPITAAKGDHARWGL
jgi:hypothetical protein